VRLETLNVADDNATRETLRNEGIEIVAPSPEEVRAWREVGARTLARMRAEGLISATMLDALDAAGLRGIGTR